MLRTKPTRTGRQGVGQALARLIPSQIGSTHTQIVADEQQRTITAAVVAYCLLESVSRGDDDYADDDDDDDDDVR